MKRKPYDAGMIPERLKCFFPHLKEDFMKEDKIKEHINRAKFENKILELLDEYDGEFDYPDMIEVIETLMKKIKGE